MAFGIGSLGQIIEDFQTTVTEIFGGSTSQTAGKAFDSLFDKDYGGSLDFRPENWTGNATGKNVLKYGFVVLNIDQLKSSGFTTEGEHFLQIPPNAIQQKELFSTSVTATRKGVLVETEGVVFKDIVIKGETGVFPGPRGGATTPRPGKSITDAPKGADGVSEEEGLSRKPGVSTVSGYEEFVSLRQFFLKYAREKVRAEGNLFMVFVNEKDAQSLIVEPLEFNMDRSAKKPMSYDYTIVMKCIGTLDQMFEDGTLVGDAESGLSFFETIGNVSANVQARIAQARATINASSTLLRRISQAVDQTFIGPLRQVQYATEDLADGVTSTLALPGILANNASEAILNIRENIKETGNAISNFSLATNRGSSVSGGASNVSTGSVSTAALSSANAGAAAAFSQTTGTSAVGNGGAASNITSAEEFNQAKSVTEAIQTDTRVPIPRSFVENVVVEADNLINNLTDLINVTSEEYNEIVGHTQTIIPSPLKTPTEEERLLLGALEDVKEALGQLLATNDAFESTAEEYFEQAQSQFQNIQEIPVPVDVKEITIQQNDTLERIAQRELGNADRWLDIVVLNKLKRPYISDTPADGVKIPGDKLLIGNR